MIKNTNSKQGFTVIEVVLVLAIAGLIFLMVFIALPALQRSQRDSQRRNDYAALASSISGIISNNSGRFPKPGATIDATTNINKDGIAPNNAEYEIKVLKADGNSFYETPSSTIEKKDVVPTLGDPDKEEESIIFVVTQANCNADGDNGLSFPSYTKTARAFAIYGALESGTYCQAVNDVTSSNDEDEE